MYDPTKPYKDQIISLIRDTWNTPYAKVIKGAYPLVQTTHDQPYEFDHTDGIGTKGLAHWLRRTFAHAVQDALAMNLNDMMVMGAIPYKLQNHLTLPEDDHEAICEIIAALSKQCKEMGICITGGETSIQNTLRGMDLSISMSGFCGEVRTNHLEHNDVLIGLPSNGIHSNGFTKVRELFDDLEDDEFVEPTKIYWTPEIWKQNLLAGCNAIIHIAGGGFTRLNDLLSSDKGVFLQFPANKVFHKIYAKGVPDEEMYRTFNCGVGMVLAIPANKPEIREELFFKLGGKWIGEVKSGSGKVTIKSDFSNIQVEL